MAVCWACGHRASTTAVVNGKKLPACGFHSGSYRPLGGKA